MKRIYFILIILLIILNGCITKRFPTEYAIYKGDKKINYPTNKIEISLLNDSIGHFVNYSESVQVYKQKFSYHISENSFLIIEQLGTLYRNQISLIGNDTLLLHKNKVFYFYRGDEKYLLYFRKKIF